MSLNPNPISHESLTVLRAVSRDPWRTHDGAELMERIFATTVERPMDCAQICESVAELESRGLVNVVRDGILDQEFDFATVQISDHGLRLLDRR